MKWILPLGIAAVWMIATGLGMYSLMEFDTTPGASGSTPSTWPAAAEMPFHLGRIHLLMFAHPQCPCTRASLQELAEIMGRSNGKVAARVLFYKPSPIPADWGPDTSIDLAKSIPFVTVVDDINGNEARRFGAETSGHTIVYDGSGNLVFSGGITKSRGQAGINAGRQTIVAALDQAIEAGARTPVFGCPLLARRGQGTTDWKDPLCAN